jgi:hypothetical protein
MAPDGGPVAILGKAQVGDGAAVWRKAFAWRPDA